MTALAKLEEAARACQLAMHNASGQPEYEERRNRYRNALYLIREHRPLDVFELMNCGLSYRQAVLHASLTGGARTDLGEECRTIHHTLRPQCTI